MADSIGPRIKQLNFENGSTIAGSQATLRLQVTDNFSGINSQKILCTIDGRWELFEFDAKTSTISHRLRSRPGGERHVLQVMVYDNAGNLSEAAFTLFY
jgi:hypothetical protein